MAANYKGNERYVIDPRNFRTDHFHVGCLVIFWLIWAPLTAFVTLLAYIDHQPFFFVWLIFGYLGTIGIPLALLSGNRKQCLEVSGASLTIYGTGVLPTSRVRIHKQHLHALTLEHYVGNDQESVYSLNLLQKQGIRPERIMLASFVHPRDKAILIEEISAFLHSHGFVFEVKNEMKANTDVEQKH